MKIVIVEMLKTEVDWLMREGILEDAVFDRAVHKVKRAGKTAKLRFLLVHFGELHGQKSVVFQFEVKEEDIGNDATSTYIALCKAAGYDYEKYLPWNR